VTKDQATSIRHRLRNLAAERREESGFVLTRYAAQRLLYRLSKSEYREQFLLKGATLFAIWSNQPHRPTRDIDLLGFGDNDLDAVAAVIVALCGADDEDDGLNFLAESVRVERMRGDQDYQGVKVGMLAMLGRTRIPLQIDVGFGDAVYPQPLEVELPGMLGLPSAYLRAYPKEAVIAEKLQAMVSLGMINSRMKDFYDLWTMAQDFTYSRETLVEAIRRTFDQRRTPLPGKAPLALTAEFSLDKHKATQWTAFLRKGAIASAPSLPEAVEFLSSFLLPVLQAASELQSPTEIWPPGGPWKELDEHL